MQLKQREMEALDKDLGVLNNFTDAKPTREETLARECKRYEALQRELQTLKRDGKIEMEKQKAKLIERHNLNLKSLKDKAQDDAEKNISEIERNIQAQNQRLEDEALL